MEYQKQVEDKDTGWGGEMNWSFGAPGCPRQHEKSVAPRLPPRAPVVTD